VDTVQGASQFVGEFFKNFNPQGDFIGRDILEDKTPDFFAALRANDSIVLSGYRLLQFNERHIDSLKHYIATFDFPADKKHIQSHLIQKLGQVDDPGVIAFFKEYYAKSYNNSGAQTKILQAIANTSDEASVRLLLDLMSQDLPLVSNKFEIQHIFRPFRDSLALARKLYPAILDYSGIAEYKLPIFSLLAELRSKDMVKSGSYKKYKKQLLNDAKNQLKRHLGEYNNRGSQGGYSRNAKQQNSLLEDYAILLYPFKKEKEVGQFFNRLSLVREPRIRTTYAILMAKNDHLIPAGMLDSLAAEINSRSMLYNSLEEIGKVTLFPKAYCGGQPLAEAALFSERKYDQTKDSLLYLGERNIRFRGKAYSGYYFKIRNKQSYDKNFKMYLIVYEDSKELQTRPFYKNEGLRIEDTETDVEAMDHVTEEFILRDRKRAIVYKPDQYGRYRY
jgi:hypothetical protein